MISIKFGVKQLGSFIFFFTCSYASLLGANHFSSLPSSGYYTWSIGKDTLRTTLAAGSSNTVFGVWTNDASIINGYPELGTPLSLLIIQFGVQSKELVNSTGQFLIGLKTTSLESETIKWDHEKEPNVLALFTTPGSAKGRTPPDMLRGYFYGKQGEITLTKIKKVEDFTLASGKSFPDRRFSVTRYKLEIKNTQLKNPFSESFPILEGVLEFSILEPQNRAAMDALQLKN